MAIFYIYKLCIGSLHRKMTSVFPLIPERTNSNVALQMFCSDYSCFLQSLNFLEVPLVSRDG